ncbi:MAG: peptidoglycan DD-metalloendopeptidase family protein [Mariprofundus sp.]
MLLVCVCIWHVEIATANTGTTQKIQQIKQERVRLARLQASLQRELGSIGSELRNLDSKLIKARNESRKVRNSLRTADRKLAKLESERKRLHLHIDRLKQAMLDEAVAAWQRSSHTSPWMGILTGVAVSDIPHRRFLLNVVMQSQQQDRKDYLQSIEQLARIETDLTQQRSQLSLLQREKRAAESKLQTQARAKRSLIKRVKHKMRSGRKQDRQLAREEKALHKLLQGLSSRLSSSDAPIASAKHIRKRKGRLPWPLKGRIVASFHSRPVKRMPRLQGVQLKPHRSANKVKAMAAGQVRYADWFGGYGLMTIVDYGDGVVGVYAHNNVLYKQLGDWVEEGDVLADSGSTGWVSKPLLYFEIRDRGKPSNPKYWCRR